MQRIQLDAVKPHMLTDEELVHYATLCAPSDLPPAWVEELVKRLAELVDSYE